MIIRDRRKSGAMLMTEGIGTHCPGSEHVVEDEFGKRLLASNPHFKEVKKKAEKTDVKKEVKKE